MVLIHAELTERIIGAAITVHSELGPGLLESTYAATVIVELKAVERIIPLHRVQLLSYLRLSRLPVGLLINFNVVHLRHGICRMINTPAEKSPEL